MPVNDWPPNPFMSLPVPLFAESEQLNRIEKLLIEVLEQLKRQNGNQVWIAPSPIPNNTYIDGRGNSIVIVPAKVFMKSDT